MVNGRLNKVPVQKLSATASGRTSLWFQANHMRANNSLNSELYGDGLACLGTSGLGHLTLFLSSKLGLELLD